MYHYIFSEKWLKSGTLKFISQLIDQLKFSQINIDIEFIFEQMIC
jgi:hypothetical protein